MSISQGFHINTEDGRQFLFRPIRPEDKALLKQGFYELSAWSRYLRFFEHINDLSTTQLKYLTEVDGINHVAWGSWMKMLQNPKA